VSSLKKTNLAEENQEDDVNNSITDMKNEFTKQIDEIDLSFNSEWKVLMDEITGIMKKFSSLEEDYKELDFKKIISECPYDTLELFSYHFELNHLHEQLIDFQKEVINLLLAKQKVYEEISQIELQFKELRSNAETKLAAHKARKEHKFSFASSGGHGKAANDIRQKDKALVLTCWQQWQSRPDSYKSKAAFARDMLDKCEHLKSQKKIEDWCREWENQNPAS
jgi:chromosome segregation ATPase